MSYKSVLSHQLVALVLAVASSSVEAVTILDQPLDPTITGKFSEFVASTDTNQQVADDFTLSERTTIDTVFWAGYYNALTASPADPVTFKIRFFNDDGAVPSLPVSSSFRDIDVLVNAVATGNNIGGIPFFSYSTTVSSLTLDPGMYWVSILEFDLRTPSTGGSQWLWGANLLSGLNSASRLGDPNTWGGAGGNMALTLTGTPANQIPEPSCLVLIGLGLAGIGYRRHRSKIAA